MMGSRTAMDESAVSFSGLCFISFMSMLEVSLSGRSWSTSSALCHYRKYAQNPQETRNSIGFEVGRVAFT